jgi:hypothetical protein
VRSASPTTDAEVTEEPVRLLLVVDSLDFGGAASLVPQEDVTHVRYEDLRRNTAGELQRIVLELTGRRLGSEEAVSIAEEFSFERQADRRPGEEDKRSSLGKGVVGDWRNHFSQEARETFDRYAGSELILLG